MIVEELQIDEKLASQLLEKHKKRESGIIKSK
jgi:hypothetical protein